MDTYSMSMAASLRAFDQPRLIVTMGVAGCGKTTIGRPLALRLGGVYFDGDDFHVPESIAKMSQGEPLCDSDRWPWLDRLGAAMAAQDGIAVGSCSALRRAYRDRLVQAAGEPILFVHLAGSRELIAARMAKRRDHFMPPSLLDSQFDTLEAPAGDEHAMTVDIDDEVEAILTAICQRVTENTTESAR